VAMNKRRIGLTFLQVLAGCCAGILVGWVSLTLINLAWQGLQKLSLGDFLTGVLLLISFLVVLGAFIATTSEGVRQTGRLIPKQTSWKRIYEGSFLGICAVVAFLSVTRGDWMSSLEGWGDPVRPFATVFYFVVVIPLKLVTFWIPSLFLIFISASIGATIAYNLPAPPERESKIEKSKKGRKEKT